jgi:hypothetical protein
MALPLASNTYRREQSRLILVVRDELVAPLVLFLTLSVISPDRAVVSTPLLTGTSLQSLQRRKPVVLTRIP